MSYTRLVIRSAIIFMVLTTLGSIALYVWRLLLAHELSPNEMGLFFAVFGFISLVGGIREFGTTSAAVKYVTEYRAKKRFREMREMVWWMFVWQMAIFLIAAVGVIIFSNWLVNDYFKDARSFQLMLWLLVLSLITVTETFFFTVFQGFKATNEFSMMGFLRGAFTLTFTFLFLRLGYGVLSPAIGYVVALGLVMLVSCWYLWRLHPQFFTELPRLRWKTFRTLARFAIPVTVGLIGTWAFSYVDTVVLTYYRSLEEVGLYAVAFSLVMIMRQLPKALSVIVFPVSVELFTLRDERLTEGIRKLQKYLLVATLPLGLGLIAYGHVAINILFPGSYIAALDILRLLTVAFVLFAIVSVNSSILLGLGRPRAFSLVMIVGAIVNVAFDLLLAPYYGLWGIGIANILCQIAMLTVSAVSLHGVLKDTTPWRAWIKTAVAGALFVVVVQLTKGIFTNIWLQLGFSLGAACVAYGAALMLLKVVDYKEVLHIARVTLMRAPAAAPTEAP